MKNRKILTRGYSLIELLVSLALVGIVLAAGGSLLMQTFSNEKVYRQQNVAQQNARVAIGTIADDMKSAIRRDTTITVGATTATLPTSTVLGTLASNETPANITSFSTPLYFNLYNDDGITVRRVRYWLNGTDLRREIVNYVDEATTPPSASSATAGTVIGRFITEFKAQKPGYVTTAPLTANYDVVRITIGATQNLIGGNGQESAVTLTTDVTLRNNLL